MPYGLLQLFRKYSDNVLAIALAGTALLYFPLLGLRFTSAGWEPSNRSSAFLFVGISFVMALGIEHFWLSIHRPGWLRIFGLLVGSLLIGGLEFLRGSAGLLFVLFLPGWAISAAVFPGREFGFPERLALATGFSIAAAILSGLVLHLTPWGLQTGIWVILLAGITVIAGAAAWRKRRSSPIPTGSRTVGLKPIQLGLIALAVLVVGMAVSVARQPTPAASFEGYTSLWIFPVRLEDSYALQVGVSSMEFEEVAYRLELQLGGRVIEEFPQIALSPGESTEVVARLDEDQVGDGPVEAMLYRLDTQGEIYRHVTWWPTSGPD